MARPSKVSNAIDPAVAATPAPMPIALPSERPIDVEAFRQVRDSVYSRFETIQKLIQSFADDYMRQTNLLLGEGNIVDNGDMANGLVRFNHGALLASHPAGEEKKERKKRTHDPNAPKRPLTPYFLYMQTARPILTKDLGGEAAKGAVQEEGQRRWAAMKEDEKKGWNLAYAYNLRLYNARVASYKSGNMEAKNMTDEEALVVANELGLPEPVNAPKEEAGMEHDGMVEDIQQLVAVDVSDEDHEEPQMQEQEQEQEQELEQEQEQELEQEQEQELELEQEQEEEEQEEEEQAEEEELPPAPIVKTPKKETRRRKAAANAAPEEQVEGAVTSASPEIRKRKRNTRSGEQAVEEPKKSGRKKNKTG